MNRCVKCREVPITLGEGRDIFFFILNVFRLTEEAVLKILSVVCKWVRVADYGLVVGLRNLIRFDMKLYSDC